MCGALDLLFPAIQGLCLLAQTAEQRGTKLELNGDVKPQLCQTILFCLIHGGHCPNPHPWVQSRVWGSRGGHRHRGAPRASRSLRASRARPPGAPARASERALLSEKCLWTPRNWGLAVCFPLLWAGYFPLPALLFSLPSRVGTGHLSQSLPVRGKTMKTLLGNFFSLLALWIAF